MPYAQPGALRGCAMKSEFNNIFRHLSFALVALVGLVGCHYSADSGSARVLRVIDGDSIRVNSAGQVLEVRLAGIDAPEYRQPHADEAKRLLAQMVLNQEVRLQESDLDRYGRTVALVIRTHDGLLVNAELIRQGAAWAHTRYARPAWFGLEQQARSAGLGLWSRQHPVPPWDWRRDHGTTYSRK
jgi:micrococcal nuclease